ncbi:hypothetical protein BC833DRAFT_612611 [Globomyces pollinis-pini]|nr:hypothetical protein BC833DRAFT_612611 [Globomyces pollinis-pini]KAJ2998201.1 hypothetical protein HDV02_004703 [Globomyces sp. JEL0801]
MSTFTLTMEPTKTIYLSEPSVIPSVICEQQKHEETNQNLKRVRFAEDTIVVDTFSKEDYDRTQMPLVKMEFKIRLEIMQLNLDLRLQYEKERQELQSQMGPISV